MFAKSVWLGESYRQEAAFMAGINSSRFLAISSAATTTYLGLSAKAISYGYDADGSRSSMATPGGSFSYAYDAAGRLLGMPSPVGTAVWTYLDNDWLNAHAA